MRFASIVLFLSIANADTSVTAGDDFVLVERSCALLRAGTRSKQLLQLLGAFDINNGKLGWHGSLAHSRFVLLTAVGPYDDDAVPEGLVFDLPPRTQLPPKIVRQLTARLACPLKYQPPGAWGNPNLPGAVAVRIR